MLLLALLIPLGIAASIFMALLIRSAMARGALPKAEALVLGAITNFFDTLGIGSFAPTMAWFKFRRLLPDRLIPCTMLVGHTPPSMTQGIIFLILLGVFVDPVLLVGCVLALLLGGIFGAPLVVQSRVWIIQLIVGISLLVAAGFYGLANLNLMPGGGTATSLPLTLMIVAIVANFIFGLLLNYGVGNYAPSLAMFSLMGMDPRMSFPIMAAGAGMAGAAAGIRHIKYGEIDLKLALGLTIGGIPAVFVAAFIVKEMPLATLRWLVLVVVLYAGLVMLRSALGGRRDEQKLTPEAAAGPV
ncbi:TSUP family transporter [Sphingomonas lutea]|uniref:Probable membrane transporter protein n=1 Tax=Sphingomonas lutea TaxID=1045317 RepID=A0A7G9SHU1_9SPHN|nr:TSUP family transporter [Sphingomonas lutea]QNN67416.1 TSUP family transporter [Sphingomonas lutea]